MPQVSLIHLPKHGIELRQHRRVMHHRIPPALSRDHDVLVRLIIEAGFFALSNVLAVPPPKSKQYLSSANYVVVPEWTTG